MADLKETKELLKGLKEIGVATKKILKDGKLGVDDLPILLPVLQQSAVLVEALAGAKEIPAEIKDLNLAEAQELLAEVFGLIKAIREA